MASDADQPRFGAEDVILVASKLTLDDATFVVGGQATNLWAWWYQGRDPALSPNDPLTSRDIDFFGSFKAARAFAEALGGTVSSPDSDTMNSPSTALVVADLNGRRLEIDFLNGVLGVTKRELERGVAIIRASAVVDGKQVEVHVPVMHPILCLKSRVANMLSPATHRRDTTAWAQLHAAIAVTNAHIDDALGENWNEAKACIQDLIRYFRSDNYGRQVEAELGVDLIDILKRIEDRPELDDRYREMTLKPAIQLLTEKVMARLDRKR